MEGGGMAVAGASGRPLEILLIEDNPGDVRLVAEALRQSRLLHRLAVADDGTAALSMLRREGGHAHCHRPDLILLDLNLPGLSGHELLSLLKSDRAFARIPVVVLTGSAAGEDVARAYDLRASCYVRKPVELDHLLGVVQSVGNFWLSVVSLPDADVESQDPSWRLLLVEDNPGDARLVRELLARPGLEIVTVEQLQEALEAVAATPFTVALVDPGLPDSSGLETIGALLRKAPMLPIVVLSGLDDENMALSAIQLGAQDYVVKGRLEPDALRRTLRYAIERKLVQERLDYLATHDGVTGLPNRHLFVGEMAHTLKSCRRRAGDAAVMSLSLSGLALVNQLHGHDFGDLIVVEAVARIRQALPAGATLACTGSAEFSTILTEPQAIIEAPHLAEALIAALGLPFRAGGLPFYLSANIGLSLFAIDADEAPALLKCAETALYQAKSAGTNTFRFYSAQANASARARLALEHELRTALDEGQFELHFQPQFDAHDLRLVGAEALLRWRHPQRGLLGPEHFLEVAEQSGLIVPIGAWVIAQTSQVAAAWAERVRESFKMSVNVSARQLESDDFEQIVRRALLDSGLAPGVLVIELTESVMQHAESRHLLMALRERGVGIAIDDFGTGFSSLAYLRRFPVDVLKIDRCFVANLVEDRYDAAIVRTIIAMARTLGLAVVAEGVETAGQLSALRAEGCEQIQGFLVGQPMPVAAFDALIGKPPAARAVP